MSDVGSLVNKKETITDNLSSAQYISIFDAFIYAAIEPIALKAGSFITQWAFDMLAVIGAAPHKRAFSVLIQPEEVSLLLGNLIVAPPNMRLHYLKKCMLDRAYTVALINRFLLIAERAVPEADPETLSPERNVERKLTLQVLGMNSWEIEPTINIVEFYSRIARTFISRIAEKYLRLAYIRTKAMMNNNMNISGEDLYSNNVMTVVRAIYKYSADKGTLTNFLILWMRSNNNPRFGHEVNIAYSLPQGKRRELTNNNWEDKSGAVTNIAVNIDEAIDIAYDADESDEQDAVLYKATAMLRGFPSVRFYAAMHEFPDHYASLTNYRKDVDLKSVSNSIAIEQDFNTMIGREPEDLPFDWG